MSIEYHWEESEEDLFSFHFARGRAKGELQYDPEIEKTLCWLRKDFRERSRRVSSSQSDLQPELVDSPSGIEEARIANAAERTLREFASSNLNQQPLCIEYMDLEVTFELKSRLIHLLPRFHGLAGEDPHKHLKEFHVVCSTTKPYGLTEEQIKLHAFPFSLADKAKDCQYKETLYEYWERFKQFCSSCSQHQIPEKLLIQYFYEGLLTKDRNMIDAASGGALVHNTLTQERNLISNMAATSHQFGTRQDNAPRKPNKEPYEQTNAVGGFPGPPQRRYDPCSNTYNPGWKEHPNLQYGARPPGNNNQHLISRKSSEPTSHFDDKIGVSCLGKLPLKTIVNPKENARAIILRSDKELEQPKFACKRDEEKELEVIHTSNCPT
ncbi:hypothetical protein AKJ16_DCAP01724 [Drosera capensis]